MKGRPKYLRNSGIQLVLVLLVGLTIKSIYNDVINLKNEWEFKRYLNTLSSIRREAQSERSDGLPCERQRQKGASSYGKCMQLYFIKHNHVILLSI